MATWECNLLWEEIMQSRLAAAALALSSFLICMDGSSLAVAAEIKLYSTVAFHSVLDELAPQFEKSTANKLTITYGLAAQLAQRITSGEAADVAILTRAGIDALLKGGKIMQKSDATLASASMALAAKTGAPKPDVSTPEAFKRTLLAAKSIATGNPASGGASSVYFSKLLEQMGISEQVKGKLKIAPEGKLSADLVAAGDAEIGAMQTSELSPGTELVGVFPGELNNVTVFAVGLITNASDANAAGTLIKFLESREAGAVYKAKGLYPN
jgi:molybdate transport system substrate-binding protein